MGKAGVIVINEKDNVATALDPIEAGATVSVRIGDRTERITLVSPVPKGHKFALWPIEERGAVIKYGEPIGMSTKRIATGEHVHVHNVVSQPRGGEK